jgi:hypothetical protein
LIGSEDDSVRLARNFLLGVINDAIERGEIIAGIEASALAEALLVLVCGVGLYAGYIESPENLLALVGVMRKLLEGALQQPEP